MRKLGLSRSGSSALPQAFWRKDRTELPIESRTLAALGQQGVRRAGPHAAAIMASCVEPATRTLSPPHLQRAARPFARKCQRPRYIKTAILAQAQQSL